MDLFVLALAIFGCMFLFLCCGLMLHFIVGCWVKIKSAMTGFEFFTGVLRLLVGIVFFPITIVFQAFVVTFD
jgi:hypothetical protein